MDDIKFLPKLSQNLLEILEDDEYYDITIEVGSDPYVKIFRAHIVILIYRSPYFRRILSTNKKKNDGILTHIKLPNILPDIFQIILRYIYGGKISLVEYETSDIIKILSAANELNLQELIPYLQSFLIKNKKDWMEQNLCLIYQMSFENDSYLKFQEFCTELIPKQPEKIFDSPDFTSISEKSLTSLIQYDNLQMSEFQIWEYVFKWSIAQNPELPSDISNYSNDDFNALKNTIQQCIPYIKFMEFTSREFSEGVFPYKKVIPKELRRKVTRYFLDPNNQNIDSEIITTQRAKLISKWIDKLEINNRIKYSYEFKLIFRGSRDGFAPKKFHGTCDNKMHTVTIIKVKDSNEILGGYNPIEWKPNEGFGITKDSFIFSFKNDDNDDNIVLSRVENENENEAIKYCQSYGPSFGDGDLKLYTHRSYIYSDEFVGYCKKNSYEKKIRETEDKFIVDEYEIFEIKRID
ncbi:hypothetical protein C1645_818279 [Glomus cerebriforme]|uniref:BTB/POZ domain-containing protein n=1 Tax=Glomus cerebriforme TaxID=658196 RepID=A0A397THD3_9GLOM|nr:hypothetical protein C1645_818279 [Glomus cerebriforme]